MVNEAAWYKHCVGASTNILWDLVETFCGGLVQTCCGGGGTNMLCGGLTKGVKDEDRNVCY